MRGLTGFAVGLACFAVAGSASALVIDFESYHPPLPLCSLLPKPSFTTQGFVFTALDSGNNNLVCFDGSPNGASNGTKAYVGNGYQLIQLTKQDAAAFDLVSMDIAEGFRAFPNSNAKNIDITGALAGGGTVSLNFVLDAVIDGPGGAQDFQHLVLPTTFRDLSSVTFALHGVSPFTGISDAYFDNLDVGGDPPATAPEPAALTLLGAGLLALTRLRSRRRVTRWRAAPTIAAHA
jgi:hypothetical protein